jgi:hypothetical protein
MFSLMWHRDPKTNKQKDMSVQGEPFGDQKVREEEMVMRGKWYQNT